MTTAASPETPQASRLVTALCLVAIVAAAAAAFVPSIDNEFLYWDDDSNYMRNPHVRELSRENLSWMWTSTLLGVWQPLTWLSHMKDCTVFGLNPAGHHSTSDPSGRYWVVINGEVNNHLELREEPEVS